MLIIDNYIDFYDYVSHIYGEDKGIVFDRRKSVETTNNTFKRFIRNNRYQKDFFIVLETGFKQYLVKLTNMTPPRKHTVENYRTELVRVFNEHRNFYGSPISVNPVPLNDGFFLRNRKKEKPIYLKEGLSYSMVVKVDSKMAEEPIDLPILRDTFFTKMLDPVEIWNDIQNYISSLKNDKDVPIPISDVEKAETKGFDKKTSFRHPVKFK